MPCSRDVHRLGPRLASQPAMNATSPHVDGPKADLELERSVLLAFRDHWTGALLRAELIERGQAAGCVVNLGAALLSSVRQSQRRVAVVLAEREAITERDLR